MPLTKKGNKILSAMRKEYGEKKGTSIFYASENKGTIKGVHPEGYRHKKGSGGGGGSPCKIVKREGSAEAYLKDNRRRIEIEIEDDEDED